MLLDLAVPVVLWAQIRLAVLACGVSIIGATSLPVSDNITVNLRGTDAQIECVGQVVDLAEQMEW